MEDTGVTRLTPMKVDFKSMEAKAESQQQLEKSMVLIQDIKKKNKVSSRHSCKLYSNLHTEFLAVAEIS